MESFADSNGSVCLTRIVQLVDTIRLDFNDPTWSNVDVAIWNIIESHIGLLAANIPLMGPLITLLGRRLHLSVTTAPPKYGDSHKLEHGFKKMDDDGSGQATLVGVASLANLNGVSNPDDEMYDMDQLGRKGIRVKTDLEQNTFQHVKPLSR